LQALSPASQPYFIVELVMSDGSRQYIGRPNTSPFASYSTPQRAKAFHFPSGRTAAEEGHETVNRLHEVVRFAVYRVEPETSQ
jgi:hypothetical protein